MFSRDTLHLWILAGALVLVGVGFFAVRALTVPPSFGQYGHYRGAALQTAADKARTLTTRGDCAPCHATLKHELGKSHKLVHCVECHGQAKEHMAACKVAQAGAKPDEAVHCDTATLTPANIKNICLHCHEQMVGRPSKHPQIVFAEHMKEQEPKDPKSPMVCMQCHLPHDPSEEPEEEDTDNDEAAAAGDAVTPTAEPAAATPAGGAQ